MLQPGKGVSSDPMLDWQQTALPTLVHNTSSVDVVKAAIGTRHAALITRAGELYTWGYGQGEGGEAWVCAAGSTVKGRALRSMCPLWLHRSVRECRRQSVYQSISILLALFSRLIPFPQAATLGRAHS